MIMTSSLVSCSYDSKGVQVFLTDGSLHVASLTNGAGHDDHDCVSRQTVVVFRTPRVLSAEHLYTVGPAFRLHLRNYTSVQYSWTLSNMLVIFRRIAH